MKSWRNRLVSSFNYPASVVALVAAIAMPLPAQDNDAAPVRIACETFGSPSGSTGTILALQLDATGEVSTDLVVSGGNVNDFAFLLLGAEQVLLSGPFDTTIFVRPDVFLPLGQFDEQGKVRFPIDLLRTDLIGSTVYMQALRVCVEPVGMWMSPGIGVRFAEGSPQPLLEYDGPASKAILIANMHDQPIYELLHRVEAPTTAWTLTETGKQSENGITRVYMTLQQPQAGATMIETKRCLIDLGAEVEPIIELWIALTMEDDASPAVFHRAARIERDF